MTERSGRVIKPPSEEFESGRIFRPLSSLRHKMWLKFVVAAFALYGVFLFAFFGPPLITIFVIEFIPLNLFFVQEGWIVGSIVFWIVAPFWLVPAFVWVHLYVKSIEYSVVGWQGGVMPEIYQRKGIITITKKYVPFKNVVSVKNRVGIFDRLYGIGTVKIETAGESGGMAATGILTFILSRLISQTSEENIEGVRFHEELKQFILKEMRGFGSSHPHVSAREQSIMSGGLFTERTLRAFQDVRDALRKEANW
ncbi:MAG: PH domain-containing protein [Candidatus Thorarchaeota archaeon]|jgi:membrane protein YdbS with pleckstrin-like domain